jgi:sugar lactone lactonase YvrE
MSIEGFRLTAADLEPFAYGLARPECVLPDPDGRLWVSDQRGSLSLIDPEGRVHTLGSMGGAPNGFACDPEGFFWIADIEGGRVCRMDRQGRHEVMVDQFEGEPLGAANFVLADASGDLWLTVSTRTRPRSQALVEPVPDGSIYRMRRMGSGRWSAPDRFATGFHFTNEIRFDTGRRALYVAETALGRITRLALDAEGSPLGPPEPFGPAPLFPGAHVDGIVFDRAGNLWVTEIRRNALIVITPEGVAQTVFEDPAGKVLNKPTSLCFAGPDLCTVIVGSLVDDHLMRFRSPIPGLEPVHWAWGHAA